MKWFSCDRKRTRGRLYSMILLPLLFSLALDGAGAPASGPEASPAPAEGASLSGRVVDDVSGEGLDKALIEIPELGVATRSGADGRFTLSGVAPREAPYEILVRRSGYNAWTGIKALREKKAFRLDMRLAPRGY